MNNLYPNLGEDDWFVRDSIKKELNAKLPRIARFLMDNDVDYEKDVNLMAKVISEHFDDTNFTHEEIDFVIKSIQVFTAIKELQEDGLIEMTEDGRYRAVE